MTCDHNQAISLPVTKEGIIFTDERNLALHVELDVEGRISIHNARLTKDNLAAILNSRMKRFGPPAVFIWADKEVSTSSRQELIRVIRENGGGTIFFVVTSPSTRKSKTDYKVLSYADYMKLIDETNHEQIEQ